MIMPRVHPSDKAPITKATSRKGPRTSSLDSTVLSDYVMHRKPKRAIPHWQAFNFLRRLAAIAAAVQYIIVSCSAAYYAERVLSGARNPTESFRVFTSSLIEGYAGEGLICDSPLVHDVLAGDTSPRDHVLFLESKTQTSTTSCSAIPAFDANIYNYEFLANGYRRMVDNTKYNITVLDSLELVVVVVDCTFRQIKVGDPSAVRVYNLVRSRTDPKDVYLVTMSMSVQDYEVREHSRKGPAVVGMLTLVRDMAHSDVQQFYMVATTYPYQRSPDFEMYEFLGITDESYLELRSIPREPTTEHAKHLITSRKRGFYDGDTQYNVRVMYSVLEGVSAKTALTRWEWIGEAVTVDSWAWVHWIHLFFGLQTVCSLAVLFLVTYQKFRSGKMWLGDPFASLSTTSLVMRGILVVLSWYIDSFWSVNEYAMSRAAMITGSQTVSVHKELMHADIMVLFLSLVGFLSSVFRERIDPAIVIFLFEFIHTYRLALVRSSSAVLNEVSTYSDALYYVGIAKVPPALVAMSPLRFWSSFQFPTKDATFLFASFFPTTYLLESVALLAIGRKVYRHFYPEQTRKRSSMSTDRSDNERAAVTLRGIVTNFEIATGAELQTRFGLISDYNNYVYFKGMKFASADGVYCSGYVIVNAKFLVKSKDLLSIAMMKLLQARVTNVYAYEVEGNTVKETARLVQPATFLWSDLWRLNATVLL
jgi:hypothetical protein